MSEIPKQSQLIEWGRGTNNFMVPMRAGGWYETFAVNALLAAANVELDALRAENERMKKLLSVSEEFRRAYQDGKYKLYAMGGEICEAAVEHLPMSEGPLDRASRAALEGK